MARTKDPNLEQKNQQRIVEIAKNLFIEKGFELTTMNDIAKEVGMSKSTLYTYFKNKEAIKNYMSLEAMEYFYEQLTTRIQIESMDLHERYMMICKILVEFKERFPLSFQVLVEEIKVDEESLKQNPILAKTYEVGELVNQFIYGCFAGTQENMFCAVFTQWGAIYGLSTLADEKEAYIKKSVGLSKKEFLNQGFEQLFQAMKLEG